MGFYGNFDSLLKENKTDTQLLVSESYLMEKVSITSDGEYQSDVKFKGINIELYGFFNKKYTEDELDKIEDKLKKEVKILSKDFDKTIKEEFEKLFKESKDYGEKYDSVSTLMKLAKLDKIIYSILNNNMSSFEIYYNGVNSNREFFGGHSFVITIHIKNNSYKFYDAVLEG